MQHLPARAEGSDRREEAQAVEKESVLGLAGALAALASTPRAGRPGPRCSVQAVMNVLHAEHPDDAVALVSAMDNASITSSAIAEVLARHGYLMQAGTLARHRRRGEPTGCRCPR